MKRFLLPLLAALALPTALNAESYWLVLRVAGNGKALEKIQMKSMDQCKEQGEIFKKKDNNSYFCLTGK